MSNGFSSNYMHANKSVLNTRLTIMSFICRPPINPAGGIDLPAIAEHMLDLKVWELHVEHYMQYIKSPPCIQERMMCS